MELNRSAVASQFAEHIKLKTRTYVCKECKAINEMTKTNCSTCGKSKKTYNRRLSLEFNEFGGGWGGDESE